MRGSIARCYRCSNLLHVHALHAKHDRAERSRRGWLTSLAAPRSPIRQYTPRKSNAYIFSAYTCSFTGEALDNLRLLCTHQSLEMLHISHCASDLAPIVVQDWPTIVELQPFRRGNSDDPRATAVVTDEVLFAIGIHCCTLISVDLAGSQGYQCVSLYQSRMR